MYFGIKFYIYTNVLTFGSGKFGLLIYTNGFIFIVYSCLFYDVGCQIKERKKLSNFIVWVQSGIRKKRNWLLEISDKQLTKRH